MATDQLLVQRGDNTLEEVEGASAIALKTPEELASIVSLFASSDGWIDKVRFRSERRWYERLY